ncbi:helix-turn-helix domain-containing protein [Streptomyces sp. NPDC057249]|uniref:helix-turn-helix domain-containing protein n=1 Tax=Streptomyces sp. NPDC057249 TaxID=3346067 RepID=UPI00362C7D8D
MARWKGLPDALDPHVRELVVRLRELKDRQGLSIAALATRTGFGKSSWDRYLNGRAVPPEEAVRAAALLCGVEPAPLLELRELAAAAGTEAVPGTDAVPPPDEANGDDGLPGPGRSTPPDASEAAVPGGRRAPVPWLAMLLSSVTTAVVMLAGLMVLAPWEGATRTGSAGGAPSPAAGPVHPHFGRFAYNAGTTYECEVERDAEDGLLYAGYSRTRSQQLQRDASGWAVVEVQCLLEHRGISAGTVDGAFGNNTDRAVRRLQDRAEIAVDGIAGPDTWKVLRK